MAISGTVRRPNAAMKVGRVDMDSMVLECVAVAEITDLRWQQHEGEGCLRHGRCVVDGKDGKAI